MLEDIFYLLEYTVLWLIVIMLTKVQLLIIPYSSIDTGPDGGAGSQSVCLAY